MENKQFDFHEIKTFEDACRHLGISDNTELLVVFSGDMEAFLQANALYKLLIIQKAMNNGKCCNENGFSYSPYWLFYTKDDIACLSEEEKQSLNIRSIISCVVAPDTGVSGVSCASAYYRGANTKYCFPLCFNSEEAALYASKQFEDLFFQYYGIQNYGIKVKS